ncbi:hypothetical protein R1sor_006075 [Riccia sorocarpa]|uniref:Uncharacterized protein n=1 Tax=Riccia sorocarpa TaxID=122646 RepID=A0ABD3HPQ9_9MARC
MWTFNTGQCSAIAAGTRSSQRKHQAAAFMKVDWSKAYDRLNMRCSEVAAVDKDLLGGTATTALVGGSHLVFRSFSKLSPQLVLGPRLVESPAAGSGGDIFQIPAGSTPNQEHLSLKFALGSGLG